MWSTVLLSVTVLIFSTANVSGNSESKHIDQLVDDILKNCSRHIRPVKNWSEPLELSLDISLHEIIELDNRKQSLKVGLWLRLYWKAAAISWNPADYGGLRKVSVLPTEIWIPDLTLFESLKEDTNDVLQMYRALVGYDGMVEWFFPRIYLTACFLDLSHFPWDVQNCNLTFASWVYTWHEMTVKNRSDSVDLSHFTANGEWHLDDVEILEVERVYPCCALTFSNLIYTLHLRRKHAYYIMNFVFPVGCVMAASILVFLVPPESGEKVSLSVTLLLSSTVFLLVIIDMLPVQSDTEPQLGWFCCLMMFCLSIATAGSALIVHCYYNGLRRQKVSLLVHRIITHTLSTLFFKSMFTCQKKECKWFANLTRRNNPTQNKSDAPQVISTSPSGPIGKTREVSEPVYYVTGYPVCNKDSNFELTVKQTMKPLEGDGKLPQPEQKDILDQDGGEWIALSHILNRFFGIMCVLSVVACFAILFHGATINYTLL